jgi:hypothetical protein
VFFTKEIPKGAFLRIKFVEQMQYGKYYNSMGFVLPLVASRDADIHSTCLTRIKNAVSRWAFFFLALEKSARSIHRAIAKWIQLMSR